MRKIDKQEMIDKGNCFANALAPNKVKELLHKKDRQNLIVCIEALHSVNAMLCFLDSMYNPAKAKCHVLPESLARKGGREIFSYIKSNLQKVIKTLRSMEAQEN